MVTTKQINKLENNHANLIKGIKRKEANMTNRDRSLSWIWPGRVATAVLSASDLEEGTFISHHDVSDPLSPAPEKHGYQRPPMEDRYRGIARYFAENQMLVTPLIMCVRGVGEKEIPAFQELFELRNFAEIKARWNEGAISIIDGQHRRGGLVKAFRENPELDLRVPVQIFFGIEYWEEATLFNIINSTQRKLPKALIETTRYGITDIASGLGGTYDHQIRGIAWNLAKHDDSVWCDQINMTGSRNPNLKITYEGLRRSLKQMLPQEKLRELESKEIDPGDLVKKYWRLISEYCNTAWTNHQYEETDPNTQEVIASNIQYRLKELVGVASLSRIGQDIISRSLEADDPVSRMEEHLKKVADVDWAKEDNNPWMRSQAGFGGQKELYQTLYNWIFLGEQPE
jgi:DGQHR domain-containing protein